VIENPNSKSDKAQSKLKFQIKNSKETQKKIKLIQKTKKKKYRRPAPIKVKMLVVMSNASVTIIASANPRNKKKINTDSPKLSEYWFKKKDITNAVRNIKKIFKMSALSSHLMWTGFSDDVFGGICGYGGGFACLGNSDLTICRSQPYKIIYVYKICYLSKKQRLSTSGRQKVHKSFIMSF
jgi:hypothetical protein